MLKKRELSERELFEEIPVPRAVTILAIPTIISQIVTMIYNLADTFFIGQLSNPYMVQSDHGIGKSVWYRRKQPDLPNAGGR